MEYNDFLEQVREELQDRLSGMNVEIRSVNKLQGKSYTGISVTPEGSNTGATMNLHSVFESLQDGVPMATILDQLEESARKAVRHIPDMDIRDISDYEQMKGTLIMQAVPTEPNRDMLAGVPHREMEDISIVYRFQMNHSDQGDATVLVTNQMLQRYGITADQLMKDAEISAPQRSPVSIRSMEEVLSEMTGMAIESGEIGTPSLMVATVPGAVNGAGVLGYPDFFQEASEKLGGSFYVLPSSVHEVLLFREGNGLSAKEMDEMVSSINASEVSPEDRLSDTAYHYDSRTHVFEKASSYEARMKEGQELAADPVPETMTVLMVEPNRYPRKMEIGTDLKNLQHAVGGDIEVVYPFEDKVGLIVNEEGKINGLPLNRALRDEQGEIYDVVAGSFMVAGLTEDSFGSLTPEQVQKYEGVFHQPEAFMKMGHGIMAVPLPDEMISKSGKASEKAVGRAEKEEKTAGHREKSRKVADHDSR